MRTEENNYNVTMEESALICWYYQCKKYTPTRISVITHMDIVDVKNVLRRNCYEYSIAERQERLRKSYEARRGHVTDFAGVVHTS